MITNQPAPLKQIDKKIAKQKEKFYNYSEFIYKSSAANQQTFVAFYDAIEEREHQLPEFLERECQESLIMLKKVIKKVRALKRGGARFRKLLLQRNSLEHLE